MCDRKESTQGCQEASGFGHRGVCGYITFVPRINQIIQSSMLGRSVSSKSLFVFALLTLFVSLCTTTAFLQAPQNTQQRPRTVGQSNANTSQQPNSSNQEVGEGDVVRVETQLVSVPTVVIDRNGHPIAGLHLEN